jgi:hypothetical protein
LRRVPQPAGYNSANFQDSQNVIELLFRQRRR